MGPDVFDGVAAFPELSSLDLRFCIRAPRPDPVIEILEFLDLPFSGLVGYLAASFSPPAHVSAAVEEDQSILALALRYEIWDFLILVVDVNWQFGLVERDDLMRITEVGRREDRA